MTFYYVLSATEESIFEAGAPSYEAIRNALTNVRVPSASWVGPGPRVTRRTEIGSLWGHDTTFAAVTGVEAPTPQQAQAVATQAARQADMALSQISNGWSPVVPQPFAETINGPLSWWQSGQATVSKTRDEFQTFFSRLETYDNPLGPDSRAIRPSTSGEIVGDVGKSLGGVFDKPAQSLQKTSNALLTVGLVVGAGAALYFAWPWLVGARRVARPNPSNLTPHERNIIRLASAVDLASRYLGALDQGVKAARLNIRSVVYHGGSFDPMLYHRLASQLRRRVNRAAHADPTANVRPARAAIVVLESV